MAGEERRRDVLRAPSGHESTAGTVRVRPSSPGRKRALTKLAVAGRSGGPGSNCGKMNTATTVSSSITWASRKLSRPAFHHPPCYTGQPRLRP